MLPTGPIARFSWGEMLDVASMKSAIRNDSRCSRKESYDPWAGTKTYAEAENLARVGWQAATEAAMKHAMPLVDAIGSQMMRDEYRYDVTGLTFDVSRVLENEPECWLECDQVLCDAPGKVLRLVFNFTACGAVGPDTIMAKGATVAALVMLLERARIRVQVDAVEYSGFRGVDYQMWCTVKEANQDLDVSRLMFAMANPAMQRRISWAVHEVLWPEVARNYYGSVGDVKDTGDIYIGCSDYSCDWKDAASAKRWVMSQLKAQGVSFSE